MKSQKLKGLKNVLEKRFIFWKQRLLQSTDNLEFTSFLISANKVISVTLLWFQNSAMESMIPKNKTEII